jgi:hypothetical protein
VKTAATRLELTKTLATNDACLAGSTSRPSSAVENAAASSTSSAHVTTPVRNIAKAAPGASTSIADGGRSG